MGDLIQELKNEHKLIGEILNEVRTFGIGTKAGQDKPFEAKNGLLAHLKKEDQHLYPVLNKAAESDDRLKSTLKTFGKDMDAISKAALDFFAKYAHGGEGLEFSRDFGRLMATLSSRISREENILYEVWCL